MELNHKKATIVDKLMTVVPAGIEPLTINNFVNRIEWFIQEPAKLSVMENRLLNTVLDLPLEIRKLLDANY